MIGRFIRSKWFFWSGIATGALVGWFIPLSAITERICQ